MIDVQLSVGKSNSKNQSQRTHYLHICCYTFTMKTILPYFVPELQKHISAYFDSSAVLELAAVSLAFSSHKVISPSAGGGGETDSEDI